MSEPGGGQASQKLATAGLRYHPKTGRTEEEMEPQDPWLSSAEPGAPRSTCRSLLPWRTANRARGRRELLASSSQTGTSGGQALAC